MSDTPWRTGSDPAQDRETKPEPNPDDLRKLGEAINAYLKPSGWYMVVAGPASIRKLYPTLGEPQNDYSFEFVVRFTGGRK